jgi:hypothetical protein
MSTDRHRYPDSLPLLEARARFFERASLGPDGGYQNRWVRVEAKPLPFYFPNTRSRVAAAKLHDLHHVATGYRPDWPGESEIAAWELAAGCGGYGWAWILNLGAFLVGLVLFPRQLWHAFLRGRRAQTLYHLGFSEERLREITVGSLRRQLGIEELTPSATAADCLAFAVWAAAALVYHGLVVGMTIAAAWWAYRALR